MTYLSNWNYVLDNYFLPKLGKRQMAGRRKGNLTVIFLPKAFIFIF
jgi:hypothetical protein